MSTNDPDARFDERFSDPGSGATPWETVRGVLESAQLFWITTVRSDGRPHVTPLVAVWLDGQLHFTTGAAEQKAVNLGGNRQVALTTGCDRWDRGLDVVVEGVAVRVTARPALERLAAAWAAKWNGEWRFRVTADGFAHQDGGASLVFGVRPAKVLAFAKGGFGQTAYRFDGGRTTEPRT